MSDWEQGWGLDPYTNSIIEDTYNTYNNPPQYSSQPWDDIPGMPVITPEQFYNNMNDINQSIQQNPTIVDNIVGVTEDIASVTLPIVVNNKNVIDYLATQLEAGYITVKNYFLLLREEGIKDVLIRNALYISSSISSLLRINAPEGENPEILETRINTINVLSGVAIFFTVPIISGLLVLYSVKFINYVTYLFKTDPEKYQQIYPTIYHDYYSGISYIIDKEIDKQANTKLELPSPEVKKNNTYTLLLLGSALVVGYLIYK